MNLDFEKLAFEFQTTSISLTKMAKREGTTRQTLAKYFRELGVEIINKQNRVKFNEHIFDVIDTEEKAYWLGFIFADGSISSNPIKGEKKARYVFEISLKGDDSYHLEKFNKFMEYDGNNVKVSNSKCGGKLFKRCRWMIANKHLWETLNSYGCVPNKSLTLQFPDESIFKDESLIRHFIRGYFDGDGCISRGIHRTIVSPVISLLGTPEFVKSLREILPMSTQIKHDKRHSDRTITLEFHKEEGIQFINYIYNNSNIHLDRKFKLYKFFKNGSRSVKEFIELSLGNIGESPKQDNTEISIETKESMTSYSIDLEPHNENIIDPRVSDIQATEDENICGTYQ